MSQAGRMEHSIWRALNTVYQFKIGPNTFILRLYARDRAHCKTEKVIHKLIDDRVLTPKLIYPNESYTLWTLIASPIEKTLRLPWNIFILAHFFRCKRIITIELSR